MAQRRARRLPWPEAVLDAAKRVVGLRAEGGDTPLGGGSVAVTGLRENDYTRAAGAYNLALLQDYLDKYNSIDIPAVQSIGGGVYVAQSFDGENTTDQLANYAMLALRGGSRVRHMPGSRIITPWYNSGIGQRSLYINRNGPSNRMAVTANRWTSGTAGSPNNGPRYVWMEFELPSGHGVQVGDRILIDGDTQATTAGTTPLNGHHEVTAVNGRWVTVKLYNFVIRTPAWMFDCTITGSNGTTGTLIVGTVTGTIAANDYLTGNNIPAGWRITANISGSGAGSTWTVTAANGDLANRSSMSINTSRASISGTVYAWPADAPITICNDGVIDFGENILAQDPFPRLGYTAVLINKCSEFVVDGNGVWTGCPTVLQAYNYDFLHVARMNHNNGAVPIFVGKGRTWLVENLSAPSGSEEAVYVYTSDEDTGPGNSVLHDFDGSNSIFGNVGPGEIRNSVFGGQTFASVRANVSDGYSMGRIVLRNVYVHSTPWPQPNQTQTPVVQVEQLRGAGTRGTFGGLELDNVRWDATKSPAFVGRPGSGSQAGSLNMGTLHIHDCEAQRRSGSGLRDVNFISFGIPDVGQSWDFDGIIMERNKIDVDLTNSATTMVGCNGAARINFGQVRAKGNIWNGIGTTRILYCYSGLATSDIEVDDERFGGANGTALVNHAGNSTSGAKVKTTDCKLTSATTAAIVRAAIPADIELTGCDVSSAGGFGAVMTLGNEAAGTFRAHLARNKTNGGGGLINGTAASASTLEVSSGGGNTFNTGAISSCIQASLPSGTLRFKGLHSVDTKQDISTLAREDGAVVFNSNAAANNGTDGAVGTGLMVCMGNATGSWKKMATNGGAGNQY